MRNELHKFESKLLGRIFEYRILIPEGNNLPSLYLLHGFNGTRIHGFDIRVSYLWLRNNGVAVILPSCGNRFYQEKVKVLGRPAAFITEAEILMKPARIRRYLMSLANTGKCPICGIGQASTLDHYLAKTIYPTYAVTPYNLVPVCKDCNFAKSVFNNDSR